MVSIIFMNSGYLKSYAWDIGWDQFLLGIENYYDAMVHEDNILCIVVFFLLYFHIIIES